MTSVTADAPALEMCDIGMRFGETWVLRHVDFEVRRGSIHALVGHNGAGKSTLMKIALGGYVPIEGQVKIAGAPLTFSQPAEARRLGLGMVFQERSLAPTLSGLDNIFLNAEPVSPIGLIRRGAERHEATQLCEELGIAPAFLARQVADMSPLEQEIVEIAKAVRLGRAVLLLDEPTAPLTGREIATMFDVMRKTAALGTGIVLITHHLAEVFAVADMVTAIREGSVTLSVPTEQTRVSEVIEAMLGRRLLTVERAAEPKDTNRTTESVTSPPAALEVRDLRIGRKLDGISFDLHPGEIVGIAGLAGSGRTTLLRTLFGDVQPSAGVIKLVGRPYQPRSPADAIHSNVYLIPEDRGVHGLVLSAPIVENIILPVLNRFRRHGFFRKAAALALAARMSASLDIRSRGPEQTVTELSGGNQQKVVLAKVLAADAKVLLLDEPTFGVDVGAAADLIRHVRSLVSTGKAALWVSSDLHELLEVADRVVVLTDGRIHQIIVRGESAFDERFLTQAIQRQRSVIAPRTEASGS